MASNTLTSSGQLAGALVGSVTGGIVNSVLGGYGAYYSSGNAGINSSGIAQGGPCAGFWKELVTFAGIGFIVFIAIYILHNGVWKPASKRLSPDKDSGSSPGNTSGGDPQSCGGSAAQAIGFFQDGLSLGLYA